MAVWCLAENSFGLLVKCVSSYWVVTLRNGDGLEDRAPAAQRKKKAGKPPGSA